MRFAAITVFAMSLILTPAMAQDATETPPPATTEAAPTPDTNIAQPEPTAEAPAAPAAQPEPERIICRTSTETGSRLGSHRRRICGTARQWEDMQHEAQQGTMRAGNIGPQGGGQ